MFVSSAQAKSWMFKSCLELSQKRESANLNFINEHSKDMAGESIAKHFLTVHEERALYKHYEGMLLGFCRKFQPPMPKNVIGCSVQYLKRFYLNNSVMDYHPKDILATCAYLATKVEEFNVSIDQFVANVRGDREKATEIILSHELLVMQQLNFDLTIYSPLRPVEGFLIDIKTRYPKLHDPEHLRPAIEEFQEKILSTDACFLYSPSQIALGAIIFGAMKFKENIEGYMYDILFKDCPEKYTYMKEAVKNMLSMVKAQGQNSNEPSRSTLEKKLEKCRNQANNPGSVGYKRKLEETFEEDFDPLENYCKLLKVEESTRLETEKALGVTYIRQ